MALVPGSLSPALAELAVQLGSALPFAHAARLLTQATGTAVSAATVQRLTERVGAAWCQLEVDLVAALEAAALDPAAAPVPLPDAVAVPAGTVLQVSVDGALVPLVGGEWTEARTAAIGCVVQDGNDGHTTALSYVSHVTDAATFSRLALAELSRRGIGDAATIVAVNDGAVWIQEFLDLHCPQATRVLDFAHAAGYLARAAQAVFGPGTPATSEWFGQQRHELRHGDPDRVLAAVAALPSSQERDTVLGYLTTRRAMLAYAQFAAAGLPVGSGCVESANKLVIEARLKGAGMHWTRVHADAMVAVRTIVDADRWTGCWSRIVRTLQAERQHRATRRRSEATALVPVAVAVAPPHAAMPAAPPPVPAAAPPARPQLVVPGKPTATHPWKRYPACTTRLPSGSATKM